jgi:tetratricopeptide (TPR) repeat protein
MVLRPPIAQPAPTYANPILPPSDAERREKLFNAINELNDTNWTRLLAKVGIAASKLDGTTQPAKPRSLIPEMVSDGLLGVLEQAALTQTMHQAQVTDLLTQLIAGETKKEWDRVIDLGERLLKLESQHQSTRIKTAAAYWERGKNYHNNGNYDRAITNYSRAIELTPLKDAHYYSRGLSYAWKGDYDRAIVDYSRAIGFAPHRADYYYSRGLSYHMKGDYDRAIMDKSRALKLDPQQALYWHQRSLSYHKKGNYDRALADCNRAIALASSVGMYYYTRGLIYKAKKSYGASRHDFEQAVRLGFALAQQELANL